MKLKHKIVYNLPYGYYWVCDGHCCNRHYLTATKEEFEKQENKEVI